MSRQQDEELRRLEQALLEEFPGEDPSAEDTSDWVDEYYEDVPRRFTVRNTDDTDVDLDSYSEEVYRGKRRSSLLPGLVTVLALCALAAMVLWLLRYLGVM